MTSSLIATLMFASAGGSYPEGIKEALSKAEGLL